MSLDVFRKERCKEWRDSIPHLPDYMPPSAVELPPVREGLHAGGFARRYLSGNEWMDVAFSSALV